MSDEKGRVYGESKVGRTFQTVIPLAVRQRLDINENDVLTWEVQEDGTLVVSPGRSRKEQIRRINVAMFHDSADSEE